MQENRKKILLVFGTRPEAIKMSPLVKEFQKNSSFYTKVCVTAQHREMLDQVLELFEITPDYDLDLMQNNQTLYDITSRVILAMKQVFEDFMPDLVIVHGDTTTTSTVSLAAYYSQIKIGHVEAGLRTGNLFSPWPEEGNRQITGVLANYHFAPTINAYNHLVRENKVVKNILVTGNTVIDALFLVLNKIKTNKNLENKIKLEIEYNILKNRKFILVTGHRRENHGEGFISICNGLKEIAMKNSDFDIVYPVHLNPNVLEPVRRILSNTSNIYLIKPLQYEHFVYLMDKSCFIITDSGGIQEEAPTLGKHVLVMRDTTERPEVLETGIVKLVGTNKNKIVKESQKLINDLLKRGIESKQCTIYGNGTASKKIVKFIKDTFETKTL
jgi:UDP-N-acetylglucosamine 2-epimerase (non-hydrolysing)